MMHIPMHIVIRLAPIIPLPAPPLRLKEILAEALAAGSDNAASRPGLGADSPANMAIKLMDCLILGEGVRASGMPQ